MTRTAEEILGKKAIAAVRRPVEKAGGLPGVAYTSQVLFSPVWERNIHHFHNELIDHLIV